jgi:hypothetical protein
MVRRAVRAVKWQAGVARNYPRWRKGVPPTLFDRLDQYIDDLQYLCYTLRQGGSNDYSA